MKMAYDGSYYRGFAKQPGNIATVQGVLENLLSHLFHMPITISAASRTDRYVHAYDQAICFSLRTQLVIKSQTMLTILNENLPLDIRIKKVDICSDRQFSPRRSCLGKIYSYQISFLPISPFRSKYYYFVRRQTLVNIDSLAEVLALFVDAKNFQSYFNYFGKLKKPTNYDCHIFSFKFNINKHRLQFFIHGDRFGRNMVRLIIGDVLDFLQNKVSRSEITERLAVPSKQYLIFKAPPQGLYLYRTVFAKIR